MSKKYFLLCLLLVLGNFILQLMLFQKGIDNNPVNSYSPSSVDAYGYVSRAQDLSLKKGLTHVFQDGFRMPGYPVFLSLFYNISPLPLYHARIFQMGISALLIFFAFLTFIKIFQSEPPAIWASFVIFCWFPFYYFSPILIAESCSLFLYSCLIFVLTQVKTKLDTWSITLPILLALLVYFKPNHILIFIPVLAFIWCKFKTTKKSLLVYLCIMMILFLLPWTLFLSIKNNSPVFLSTTLGINLYLGTGVETNFELSSNQKILPTLVAKHWNLESDSIKKNTQNEVVGMTVLEQDRYLKQIAKEIWQLRPLDNCIYGVAKIFHGFGFSMRGLKDFIQILLLVTSALFSLYLWNKNQWMEWCIFYWTTFTLTSIQLFFFLPDQRFKIVIFDLPALILILMGIYSLIYHQRKPQI